jgi:two-component sensor histidine kinase
MGNSLFQTIVHPDDFVKVKAYHDRIHHPQAQDLESGDLFTIEYRMLDINNKWKWFYSKETIFSRNLDGTIKQTIGTASDITQLKEVETKLQSSLAEKEVLLREVHHRVKNNLSIVDSLLSMQSRYVNDAEILRSISDSQRRIHTMSLIHEQLYQSHDVDNLDFCEYLQRLVGNLYSSFSFNTSQIELKLDINPILGNINIDTAISMGLIVNELLTNAFKHAFPDGRAGLIEVILYESITEQNLHLIVRDDGIGISQEIISNTTASLGLRIVHILTQQLRASLNLSCSQGTSFHFTLSYPKD